jgi:LmbE family N-acetylglucosaminyl deacetylase
MDPLDVLAIVAHPDDAELSCGGSLLASKDRGERTGILDLTRGRVGSQGTPEIRAREAERAAEILGLVVRRNAGFPDHRVAAERVYDSSFLSGLKDDSAACSPHRPFKVIHAPSFREEPQKPTFVVDISRHVERKLEAIAAFESQFGGAVQAGEVFPGGGRALSAQVRTHAARAGSLIRTEYGEPFWTRETVEVGTVGSFSVSTF